MKKQLFLLVMMFLPMVASAYDFKSDGLFFNILSSTELSVEITSGDETYNFREITLPTTVIYKNIEFVVTKIGDGAFSYATFDGITIPASIKSIGNRAFAYSSYYNKPYYICFEGDISIDSEAFWCSWYGTFIFKNGKAPVLIDDSNRGYLFNSNPIMCIPDDTDEESFMEFASRGRIIPYDYSSDISMLKFLALSQFQIELNGFEYEIISLAKPYSAMLTAVKKDGSKITLPSSFTYNNYNFNVFCSGENIFSNENSLKELIIPEGYISMEGSIGKCDLLTKISIPSTITKINKAFVNCPNLEQVESLIIAPFETDAFNVSLISLFTTLYVPDESIEKYKTTTPWNEFLYILPISSLANYKLVYIVDDVVYKEIEYEFGAPIIPEAAPAKEGYTFTGWSEIPETMPAHDVTVTGTFSINKYKLTYIVDGEEYKGYEVEYGASITPETAPMREGYTFSGWSEMPETMPAHDVTVTGMFNINKYKFVYTVDEEEYKSYEVEYGTKITPEPAPVKEGYTFSGWREIPETMPAHDVKVTGSFTINSYKLSYMIDDAVYKETMYEYGATITPEPQPEGDYATFEWKDLPQTMPAHDVIVYASYTSKIIEVLMTTQRNIRIYSPNGKKLDKLQKGLNIVVLDDGTVKKVVVK